MTSYIRAAAVLALSAAATGCVDDDLTGPGLTENPNFPVVATAEQLMIGMQARQFVLQEGQLARQASIYTQQLAGINNQQREWGSWYNFTENDVSTPYDGFFIGGGLVDMRKIRQLAEDAGDVRLEGIIKVWEAFSIGTAASLWGDLPYREAVTPGVVAPALDPQRQVYEDVQKLLDEAIADLTGAPTTAYPQDLIYNGDPARWRAAAYTLKARYHLHVAPRLGAPAYQAALAAAQQGITQAPANAVAAMNGQGPGDFRTFHGTTLPDANIWAQFLEARQDIVAGARLVDVLATRSDPRLDAYFDRATDGAYRGANQFGFGPSPWSTVDAARAARPFRQPLITWAENQLIMAEANLALGNTAAALTNTNAVRTAVGLAALPAPITLERIMVEKWVTQFQNIDVYSDYRRTCFPRLVPGGPNNPTPAASIPGRFPYSRTERLQNPNIPAPAAAPAKNWNYAEITCPTTGGTI